MTEYQNIHMEAFHALEEEAKKELGSELEKLILYGSVAKGNQTEESDVDVFAVVRTSEKKEWLQQRGAEIGIKYGLMLTSIVRTREEYEQMKDTPFGREVRRTGEVFV